ncbi:CHASE3 domain-containing protein [Gottfriedia solisilvae]|uniref:Uncharacterized protein n=1 Tax=Gottfriedia solisilvae TaxID=1516104 RepID=A0A8J3AIY4_9BACI|nr:hypothetical protein [Gottfriedia solisilvae]GGI10283.1 hypothetical protein GCM10007380_02020 [Gottfriedia solisilvae]
MKIRNQLIIGFSIIILLTISMFTYNFYIGKKNINSIALIGDQTNDVSHAREIEFLLSGHSNDQRGYLLSGDKNYIEKATLEEIAQHLTALSQENSASSEEQLASLQQISATSQSLSAIAEELENETQRFKI